MNGTKLLSSITDNLNEMGLARMSVFLELRTEARLI